MTTRDLTDLCAIPSCPECGQDTRRNGERHDRWLCDDCDYEFTPVRALSDLEPSGRGRTVAWVATAAEMGLDPAAWPKAILLHTQDGSRDEFRLTASSRFVANYRARINGEDLSIEVRAD